MVRRGGRDCLLAQVSGGQSGCVAREMRNVAMHGGTYTPGAVTCESVTPSSARKHRVNARE